MIVCALLHDSALLSGFVLNLSPRSARYAILSPGSGQGRPAVGVGAVRCSCACSHSYLGVCVFPVYLLRLDKVLWHHARKPRRGRGAEGDAASRMSERNPNKQTTGGIFFVFALNEALQHPPPPNHESMLINFSPAFICTTPLVLPGRNIPRVQK